MRKMMRKLVVLIMAAVLVTMVTVPVMATEAQAATNPYTDVTVKYVGKDAYNAITYVKKHHGFDNLYNGKKFGPYKYITRREFLMILINMYGSKYVPVTATDLLKANNAITSQWACNKMVAVAAKLKCKIKWEAGKDKLTRAGAAQYLKIFADFRPALKPKR